MRAAHFLIPDLPPEAWLTVGRKYPQDSQGIPRAVNFASCGIAVINMMSVTICGNNLIIPLFIFVNLITETGILIPLLIYFSARWRNTLPKQVGDYWLLNYLLPESGDKRGES